MGVLRPETAIYPTILHTNPVREHSAAVHSYCATPPSPPKPPEPSNNPQEYTVNTAKPFSTASSPSNRLARPKAHSVSNSTQKVCTWDPYPSHASATAHSLAHSRTPLVVKSYVDRNGSMIPAQLGAAAQCPRRNPSAKGLTKKSRCRA